MMRTIIFAILILCSLSGCEKFLNINPINKAYEDELFADRSGFESVLAGVYHKMASVPLYGKELKFGFMETLVGSYTNLNSSHYYYHASQHQYNYNIPLKRISEIWSESYNLINQTNIILKNIENIKDDSYYNLVKGEALGIRCLMHFQLLKLFGPVIKEEGIEGASIPYKEKTEFVGGQYPTTQEFLEKLEKDLAEARALLINDPLRTNLRDANLNILAYERYNSLIDYRAVRMNYYAVISLQALVAQWKGDLVIARQYAEELLEEFETKQTSIRLITAGERNESSNSRFPMENIFALLSPNLLQNALIVHTTINDDHEIGTTPYLFPNYNFLLKNLYNVAEYGSINDFRLLNWFGRYNEESTTWKLIKFVFDPKYLYSAEKKRYENKIISIHTIYMIAAEEYAKSDPNKAISYLNKVRNARNITKNIEYKSELTEEIILNLVFDEMRKDNIDEGYMFGEYKRQFRAIHRARPVKPTVAIFKFPIPVDEQLYNPQNK
ncbi:RagB/SusD family nutrient uptake outer membrane protein [Sphingobacterium sp. HJSM2_6]|uniref:RagB/SusD family nutrient uptake outer membrane protein n=1 Tax=Sphingobacterium sp. HJSM2_6 TaxID=3366264 RepID=UPI003BD5DA6D